MQSGDTPSPKSPNCAFMLEQLIAGFVERRHKLGKIEAIRHKARDNIGTRGWQSTSFDRFEGEKAVVSQLTGALTRAVLIMVLVATPSMLPVLCLLQHVQCGMCLVGVEKHKRYCITLN